MAEPVLQSRIPKAGSVFVMHPFENPLTVEEVEQMRTRVIANFKNRFQNPDHPLVFGSIDVPESAFIAAYGFTIYADGVTAEYLGLASDPQSVSIIHKNAQKWHKETETYASFGDQIPCSGWWKLIGTEMITWYDCPYGAVTNNYELYLCENDDSSSYDWYGIIHTFEIIPGCYTCGPPPGCNTCDNEWVNHEGHSIHKWCATTLQNPLLVDSSPNSYQKGPKTVTVCLSAPLSGCSGRCWDFFLKSGTEIYHDSSSSPVKARWRMEFTTKKARENIREMVPGSICRVDEPSTPGVYILLGLKSKGCFTDGTNIVCVEHIWGICVEY